MGRVLESTVTLDDFTAKITKCFDYEFDGTNKFVGWDKPEITKEFNIGLIVGSSGSGKSTLLKDFGKQEVFNWHPDLSVASHFATPEESIDKLSAVGLNSIPSWTKPFYALSNGEAFRADLARRLSDNVVIDEFTSVVDRTVAKACCTSIAKYIRKNNLKNIVLASCHKDIEEWLEPDWIFDTDTGEFNETRSLRRPEINLEVFETSYDSWKYFSKHHYLNNDMNKACRCYLAFWEDNVVAFSGNLSLPGRIPPLFEGDTRNKFRESRLVVLPDYQGMGIGTRMSNAVGEMFLNIDYRYFSKTAHIRMGEYRQHSKLWRPTSTNLKSREKSQRQSGKDLWHHLVLDTKRLCYSHEYIGSEENPYRIKYENSKVK